MVLLQKYSGERRDTFIFWIPMNSYEPDYIVRKKRRPPKFPPEFRLLVHYDSLRAIHSEHYA
jgi:hypothetical protein